MADIGAMDDTVRDPSSYARRMILDSLPPHAQARYRAYGERRAEAETLLRHLRERGEALTQLMNVAGHNAFASQSREQDRALAILEAERDQLQRRHSKIDAARVCYGQIVARLDNWLTTAMMQLGEVHWTDDQPPIVRPHEGESFSTAIERVRQQATRLQHKLGMLRDAPPPPDETRAMIKSELDRLSRSMQCGFRFERNPHPLTGERLVLHAPDIVDYAPGAISASAVTAWLYKLFPEQVLAEFIAHIDDNAQGVPRARKPQMLAELEVEIIATELEECSLVEAAQVEGLDLLPRASAHPWALLGLVPQRPAQSEVLQAAE